MTGSSKRKGDRAELEVQAMWRDHCGVPARRALGAGRKDDMGDIDGVPFTVIQVANYKDVAKAVRHKPLEAEQQRLRTERAGSARTYVDGVQTVTEFDSGAPAVPFAASFIRLRGTTDDGEPVYRVVMTPEQFFAMWREAIN